MAEEMNKDEGMDYVQFCDRAWKSSDSVWKSRRNSFDESWALFWNRYDFSKKAAWQSKNFAPKMNRMVRQAAYAFKSALVGINNYFSVEGVGKKSRERAWVAAKLMKYWLDKNDFTNQAVDSLFASLLSSLMVFKIYWETKAEPMVSAPSATSSGAEQLNAALAEVPGPKGVMPGELSVEKRVYGCLRIEAIDPNRVRIDPTGRRKYVIHEFEMDLHDLKELAKVKANRYEKDEIDALESDFVKSDEKVKEKLRRGESLTADEDNAWRRVVIIREYHGETFDEKGNLVGRNMMFSIANEKRLIRKPFKNPYFADELCWVWGAPLRVPFSNLHQSFAENINGLCRIATEILNLTMDSNLWSSIKAFELDLDAVVDPNQFKQGVYPGKVFTKRSRGVPRPMLTPLEMGMTNPQNLQFYGAIERESQNATGVNEFAAGFVGSRKTELATEINVKSAESKGYLNAIAQEAEELVFDKVLEKSWRLIMAQQDDFRDEELRELLGDDVADLLVALSDEGRKEYLGGKYQFRFRGMSSMLEKGQELEKFKLVTELFNKVPEYKAALKAQGTPLLRKLFDALNWNPEEFIQPIPNTPPPGTPSAQPPAPGMPGSPAGAPPLASLMAALAARR